MRYFLDISYHGGSFHGWQRQPNALGVQEVLEEALRMVLRLPELEVLGSGRTDTGVHAKQQIVHLDLEHELTDSLVHKVNCILPKTISINRYYQVLNDAHARFDATFREYEYHISKAKDPFTIGLSYLHDRPLDVQKMNEAAALMLGKHDFQCFSKSNTDVENYFCTIFKAEWEETSTGFVFYISANRFLRGMVRAVVGTLLPIGRNQSTIESFKKVIESKDRKMAGAAAPPEGLFLTKVEYPESVLFKK